MSPLELMRSRRTDLRLVIFDCDGVLVDSEPVSNRIVAEALSTLGWEMTAAEAERRFLGLTLTDMVPLIEDRLGRRLPPGWKQALTERLVAALAHEAVPVAGAYEALQGVSTLGLPWRVASNSSHEEMQAKFGCIGLAAAVAGRLHSHRDVRRGKPAPDLFLAAAAAEGVGAEECVVIEDSVPGARAAATAGMDCLGYAPGSDGAALRAVGAVPFHSMFELAALLAAAPRRAT